KIYNLLQSLCMKETNVSGEVRASLKEFKDITLKETQVADLIGVKRSTLGSWRRNGIINPLKDYGNNVYKYRLSDIMRSYVVAKKSIGLNISEVRQALTSIGYVDKEISK